MFPLQPMVPTAIDSPTRRSGIEGEDRPGKTEETAVGDRSKISGVIGARKGRVEKQMPRRYDTPGERNDRPALPVAFADP